MPVADIISEGLRFHHPTLSEDEVRQRVAQVLEEVELPSVCADRYPHEFSGGQRQRIGLARAAYGNPKLILLDEPNSNLDDIGEKELIEALQKFREMQSTTIVITHRTKLLKIVDKILVMRDGATQYFGPREQVLGALGGSPPKLNQSIKN